jgi:xanthine dehydrogenase YagS FAD-binding subunit
MQAFEMLRPTTLEDALGLLSRFRSEARVYAGGQDLLYRYKKRLAANPQYLVNISRIASLRGVELVDDVLRIRPLTTLGQLERSALVREQFPLIHAAVSEIASPQIRNVGTVGGNLCQDVWCWYLLADYDCWLNGGKYCYAAVGDHRYYHSITGGKHCIASHPSDLAPALVALGATCTVAGPDGQRSMPIEALWPGFQRIDGRLQNHAIGARELLVEIAVPVRKANQYDAFLKFRMRNAWDFALATVAASVAVDGERCASARVVLGGIGTQPHRARDVEFALVGNMLTESSLVAASARAASGARPLRQNGYKLSLTEGLCRKVLRNIRQQMLASPAA